MLPHELSFPMTTTVTSLLKQCEVETPDHGLKLILADACQDEDLPEDVCAGLRAMAIYRVHPYYSKWGTKKTKPNNGWGMWGGMAGWLTSPGITAPVKEAIIPIYWWEELTLGYYTTVTMKLTCYETLPQAYLMLAVAYTKLSSNQKAEVLKGRPAIKS